MELYPFQLSYVIKTPIWGGTKLLDEWNKHADAPTVGESWELSVRELEKSKILNGAYAEKTLADVIATYGNSLIAPDYTDNRFPLLIKFIDAKDTLSVQVHPDDAYASRVEQDRGKTEMWYIVDAEEGAELIMGLKDGVTQADFAAAVGAPAIITHCGFIPETPKSPLYMEVLDALGEIASYCNDLGIGFWFETGQETPVTLLRTIQDINLPNLGINLDTANIILYGKGNPLDALDVFGPYVRNLHVKDGVYPVDGCKLGHEVAIGKGKVDFKRIIPKLHELGFKGELVIEREISGEQQAKDIMASLKFIGGLVDKLS